MMKRTAGLLIALFLSAQTASAATYHVDAVNGNDATGDGSADAPFRSLATVRPLLIGGDTVVLYDGNYGPIEEVTSGGPYDLYTDWVTYQAAPGSTLWENY